jgi:ABC-type sugar transport system ATPase subunit
MAVMGADGSPVPSTAEAPREPILELRGIERSFGHVQALRGISLTLGTGEILGIVGDNGAGKSTLMKIVAGTVTPDAGEIYVNGSRREIRDAETARTLGIEMIYQHLALFDNLDVAANIFIGREPLRGLPGPLGFIDRRRAHREAKALLERLGIHLSSTKLLVEGLSGGQRQMVAIARAVAFEDSEHILIMDEPSAALGATESATVMNLIRTLRDRGLSIMVISHRIPEVLELADRVAVLKRGELVAVVPAKGCTVEECVRLIVAGRAAQDGHAVSPGDAGE